MDSTGDHPQNKTLTVYARSDTPDVVAPDGSTVYVLMDQSRGATRLSLAEAVVGPGERTACISHRTIEEVWYVLRGAGTFHQTLPNGTSAQAAITAGDALLIATGTRFWVDNPGPHELAFLCCDAPGWPGPEEAIVHDH